MSSFMAIPSILLMLVALGFMSQGHAYARQGLPDPGHNFLKGLAIAGVALAIGYLSTGGG